ncbi:MAG: nucleotidyltransferase domain-containing protein [Candidatus Hatepunaea meridiana]|nr:nucleotidyltransferase domain-containing protein [Candidatus Hatepunaea meridiana]
MIKKPSTFSFQIKEILNLLLKRCSITAIYHFGSSLGGKVHDESDIDIGVLFRKIPDAFELLDIQEDLSGIAGQRVDLVVLNDASPILQMQVIRNGKPVFILDSKALDLFVLNSFSMYCDLKVSRLPVEESMLNKSN